MEKIYMCPVCNAELKSKNTVDNIVERVIQHYKKTHPKIIIPEDVWGSMDHATADHTKRKEEPT